MNMQVWTGILLPFLGTSLGAAMVFVLKDKISDNMQRVLTGFAAGVMVAASFWSLLSPALESAEGMGRLSFIPAAVGFLIGIGFLLFLDTVTPHMHMDEQVEGPKSSLKRTTKLILAVTLHNIPEGMAVGIVYAGWVAGEAGVSQAAALALALGISLQNFPEGAIISMPLQRKGISKGKSFWYGTLSGVVEPLSAIVTLLLTSTIIKVLPYLLSFAAGAMIYVVIEELIPDSQRGNHTHFGTIGVALGFILMMVLDVSFG